MTEVCIVLEEQYFRTEPFLFMIYKGIYLDKFTKFRKDGLVSAIVFCGVERHIGAFDQFLYFLLWLNNRAAQAGGDTSCDFKFVTGNF